MPNPNQIDVKSGDNLLLVGTTKGAFVFRSDANRANWEEAGPFFPGRSVYAMAYDGRNGRQRLWTAVNSSYWGSFLSSSNDFGKTWSDPETYNVKFPEGGDVSLKQIWQIAEGHPGEPDTLYCGVEPAALFKSTDAGDNWSLERGLFDHPHRPEWQPGGGGLCLHTILPDPSNPERMHIAISTGGVYRTDDGGKNWEPRNKGICARFMPRDQQYPEWGQCVHKVVRHPSNPDRMFFSITGRYRAMMPAIRGRTSARVCHRILVSPWRWIRMTRAPSTSSRSSLTSFVARPKPSYACIAHGMAASHGRL